LKYAYFTQCILTATEQQQQQQQEQQGTNSIANSVIPASQADSKQADHIRKQTTLGSVAGSGLLVVLMYKYRNNHLKILLKLFYNLRLFDARESSPRVIVIVILIVLVVWVWTAFLSARSMCKFHCKATLFSLSFERNFPSAITSEPENADTESTSHSYIHS